MAFSCMTTDIVTEYAFTRTYNFLDSPTFESNLHDAIVEGALMGPVIKQFPWLQPLLQSIPESESPLMISIVLCANSDGALMIKLSPGMSSFLRFQKTRLYIGPDFQ